MNIHWDNLLKGAIGLTSNPATMALFNLIGLAVQAVGVPAAGVASGVALATKGAALGTVILTEVQKLKDAVEAGTLPDIDLSKERHDAALALAINAQPVPDNVPRVEPPPAAAIGTPEEAGSTAA